MNTNVITSSAPQVALGRLPAASLVAALTSAGLNLLLFFVATSMFGLNLQVSMSADGPPIEISALAVAVVAALPAFAAAAFLALLTRFVRRPLLTFQIIGIVGALLSLIGPLSTSAPFELRLVLVMMHLIAAASIVGVLSVMARVGARE